VVLLEELHHPIIGVQNLFAVLGEGNLPGISQVLKRSVAPSGKVFYFLFGQEFLAGGFADKFGYKVANGTFNGFRYGRIEFASAGYVCLHDVAFWFGFYLPQISASCAPCAISPVFTKA
jgi:hypothetical protein